MFENEVINRMFRLADRIDSRSPDFGGTTAKEIVEDWISNGELPLAVEMLADAIIGNDVFITREDYNDFLYVSKQINNSERVVNQYLESLVRS